MIVGAFLQPPGLPLLRGGVVAVVVQQEGPHLAADGWVDATEEDRLGKEVGGGGATMKQNTTITMITRSSGSADGEAETRTTEIQCFNSVKPRLLR